MGVHKEPSTSTKKDLSIDQLYKNYFEKSSFELISKLENFPKYVKRQNLTYFISKYELFKQILGIHGSIVECGVLYGGSLLAWAQLSAIFEPLNHNRKIIGFDTFDGFKSVNEGVDNLSAGLLRDEINSNAYHDVMEAIEIFDKNRFLSHIPKIELVKGDVTYTSVEYIKQNPHLVVSLLYLDCDIYEPTKAALKHFLPRMPKGALIVFDELNAKTWPGETMAVMEEVGIRNLKIQRFPHDTMISYAVL